MDGGYRMFIKETDIGFEINSPAFFFFFGKKNSNLENLQKIYPQYQFLKIKQVHGDQLHEWKRFEEPVVEADGHSTHLKRAAMLIATADCVPVLVVHPHSMTVMALHAGWRGVASRIIPQALHQLISRGAKAEEIFVIVGPHIQQNSFEVGTDVSVKLMSASTKIDPSAQGWISRPNANAKFLVDLNAIVKLQISEFDIPSDQVFNLLLDTFSDLRFHSFRRDKEHAGRQLSFVVRK